jgi:copper chaperone CopZ
VSLLFFFSPHIFLVVLFDDSEGCASAVKRILGKVDGVSSVETDVTAKSVVVQADDSVSPQDMLQKLEKWGQASGKTVALA